MYGSALTSATFEVSESWAAGVDGFSYGFFYLPQNATCPRIIIYTYDISDSVKAAMDKHWYAQNWVRTELWLSMRIYTKEENRNGNNK